MYYTVLSVKNQLKIIIYGCRPNLGIKICDDDALPISLNGSFDIYVEDRKS